jgi:hypothetical protein
MMLFRPSAQAKRQRPFSSKGLSTASLSHVQKAFKKMQQAEGLLCLSLFL